MEYFQGKIYMITAVPLNIENRKLVLEMLKDVTGSIVVSELGNENNIELENYIKQFNELAIKDSLTGIFNRLLTKIYIRLKKQAETGLLPEIPGRPFFALCTEGLFVRKRVI